MLRIVKLNSGGSVALSARVDLFALSPEDRQLIFDLTDRLNRYEQTVAGTETRPGDRRGRKRGVMSEPLRHEIDAAIRLIEPLINDGLKVQHKSLRVRLQIVRAMTDRGVQDVVFLNPARPETKPRHTGTETGTVPPEPA